MNENKIKAILAILGAAVLGGGIPIFSKIGLREIPALSFAGLRFFIASLILLPFAYKQLPRNKKDLLRLVGVSLFATVNISLYVFGIRLTGATMSQLIYSFVPVMIAIISYFVIKEKVTRHKLSGIFLGLLGTMLIVLLPLFQGQGDLEGDFMGNVLILIGVIAFSFYPVLCKKLQKRFSPLTITTVFVVTTAGFNLILSLVNFWVKPFWWQSVSIAALGSLLYVGVLGGAGYYLLHQYAVKHGTPIISSMILYLQPITVFLWAAAVLGERLSALLIFGGAIILSGAYLVTQAKD